MGSIVTLRGCRAHYFIRVVPPELSQEFANSHDEALWKCLSAVLGVPPTLCNPRVRDTITLPLAFGGMGLRSASRTAIPAYWASWGDALNMIAQRHRVVAATLVHELAGRTGSAHLSAAVHAANQLTRLDGFDIPGWADITSGARPLLRNVEDLEPGGHRTGWQHRSRSKGGVAASRTKLDAAVL